MAEQRWTAPESGWYRFGLPLESADVQYAEFDTEEHKPGDFLPGGPGWDARQQKIRDDVSKAFELPEGLTWEWGRSQQHSRRGRLPSASLWRTGRGSFLAAR